MMLTIIFFKRVLQTIQDKKTSGEASQQTVGLKDGQNCYRPRKNFYHGSEKSKKTTS